LKETLNDDALEELDVGSCIGTGELGEFGAGFREEILEVFFTSVQEL
jgi:hypothetical protein